jgi:hypothetical protein
MSRQLLKYLLLLEVKPPSRLAPKLVVSSSKFVTAVIWPTQGKWLSSSNEENSWKRHGSRKGVKRDSYPNELLYRDIGFTVVNLNFKKQSLCLQFGLPHFIFPSTYVLIPHQSIWLCLFCVQRKTSIEGPHQVWFVLELIEGTLL